MPGPSQHSPDRQGRGKDFQRADLGSRFTAVNSYSVSPSPVSAYPPSSFAFRPDTTSPVDIKEDRLDSLRAKSPSETSNPDASSPPTLAKRKRSPSDLYGTGTSSASTPKKLDRDPSPRDKPKDNMSDKGNKVS